MASNHKRYNIKDSHGRWVKKPPIDPNKLYLCHGRCSCWLPANKFKRKGERLDRPVTAKYCNVCRRLKVGKWLGDYYQKLRDDPIARQAAIDNWPPPPKIQHNIEAYMRWRIERNSFLSRIGVIPKKGPFDYVAHMMRKVKYGQLSMEDAVENIATYRERHPDPREKGEVILDVP